ncbi:MAG: HEPN domain-containing protein [Bacteroidota bacterium]
MTEEIKIIIEKSEHFLKDASVLMTQERYEGAVNRAYYAAFTAIRAMLFAEGIFAKTHSGVHTKFRELFIKAGKVDIEYSEQLAELADQRQRVDYDFYVPMEEDETTQLLDYAKKFIDLAKNHVKNHK